MRTWRVRSEVALMKTFKKMLLVLTLVALCFGMVACDKDVPADPVGPGPDTPPPVTPVDPDPIDPSDPDTPVIPDPVVPDPVDPTIPVGVTGVRRYLDIVMAFEEQGVPSTEINTDTLLGMLREEGFYTSRYMWEELIFAILESADEILDNPYIEFDGKPYWIEPMKSNPQDVVQWTLKGMTCENAEYSVLTDTPTTGKLDIDIKGLAFEILVSNPEGLVADMTVDIQISARTVYNSERDEWFWNEETPITARMTVNSAEWPEFETIPLNFSARYDGDFYDYGYTVSFDTNGGKPIDSIRFPGVMPLDPKNLPSAEKENALFRGWELSPGDFIHDHENNLWPDCGDTVDLTAVYWETPLPENLEAEANLTYRFLETLSEIKCAGKEQTKLQDLFDGSTEEKNLKLLDMFLLLIGKEDECGGYPFMEIHGTKYYGSKKKEGAPGLTASTNPETSGYRFSIEGTVTTNGGRESPIENGKFRLYTIGDASIRGGIPSWDDTDPLKKFEIDLPLATVDKTSIYNGSGYELTTIDGEVTFKDKLTDEESTRTLNYDVTAGMGYYGDYLITSEIWSRISMLPSES